MEAQTKYVELNQEERVRIENEIRGAKIQEVCLEDYRSVTRLNLSGTRIDRISLPDNSRGYVLIKGNDFSYVHRAYLAEKGAIASINGKKRIVFEGEFRLPNAFAIIEWEAING